MYTPTATMHIFAPRIKSIKYMANVCMVKGMDVGIDIQAEIAINTEHNAAKTKSFVFIIVYSPFANIIYALFMKAKL